MDEPELAEEARRLVEEIRARMPIGAGEGAAVFGETVETLLAEAREVALARAAGRGEP
jgi:hypothetical protein